MPNRWDTDAGQTHYVGDDCVPAHGQLVDVAPTLPNDLTEAQLDGRACIRCGHENGAMRPVEAWSVLSSQLFECVDSAACAERSAGRTEEVPE
jgi:hypothetical protein